MSLPITICRNSNPYIYHINNNISYDGNQNVSLSNSITSVNIPEIENNGFLKGI
jgi:hypothetical protein